MNQHSGDPCTGPEALQRVAPAQHEVVQPSLLHVLWRRRWIAALATVFALAGALTYLSRATPLYTSTSRLYVEKTGPKIISDAEGVMTQSWNYLYTQGELLKSTPIVVSALEQPGIRQLKTLARMTNPVGYLKSALDVTVGKQDEIINVSLTSPHPQEAARLVNAVVDAYVTFHANQKRSTAAEVLRILQKEKTKRDAELMAKLKAMLAFKQDNPGLACQSKDGNVIMERLARLSDALATAQLETIDAEAGYQATKAMSADPGKVDQLVAARRARGGYAPTQSEEARTRAEIERLELQLVALKRRLTDDHPTVQAAQDRVARLNERLSKLAREFAEAEVIVAAQRLEVAKRKEAQIRGFLKEQREEAQGLNVQLAQLALLQSDWEQTRKLCDILDDRIKELNVTEDTGALNITILEVARPGQRPTSPRKARTMATALALGLMLGVGLALAREWMDQRFHSAEEISAALGTPVLGVVPAMASRETLAAHGRKVEKDSTSHAAESYRTVRTAIYFGVPNGHAKTVLVTSPAPGDGKTTLVSNLGIAMAQAGQRTLILDADFRKPMQHNVFGIDHQRGLSGVLAGREPLADVVRRTGIARLDILTCGPIPPNPSEMLNSKAFVETLDQLKERYDHILIDSPPVTAVTDARILGAVCDLTLLVLRAGKSHRRVAARARDELLSVGAHLLGTVVNAVPRREDRYYYYAGYGYHDKHSYGYGHGRHGKGGKGNGQGMGEAGSGDLLAPAGTEGTS